MTDLVGDRRHVTPEKATNPGHSHPATIEVDIGLILLVDSTIDEVDPGLRNIKGIIIAVIIITTIITKEMTGMETISIVT